MLDKLGLQIEILRPWMNQKTHLKKMFIVASIMVAMIGTVAVVSISISIFNFKVEAATAAASMGSASNATKNKLFFLRSNTKCK